MYLYVCLQWMNANLEVLKIKNTNCYTFGGDFQIQRWVTMPKVLSLMAMQRQKVGFWGAIKKWNWNEGTCKI